MNSLETIVAIVDAALPPTLPVARPAPLSGGEAKQVSQSSQKRAKPRKPAKRGAGDASALPTNAQPLDIDRAELNQRLAFYPQTDLGNAERFRDRYRGRIIWSPVIGWLVWDGRRWSREGADERVRIAEHDTVRAIQDEAEEIADTKRDLVVDVDRNGNKTMLSMKLRKWGRSSEGANKINAISKHAGAYLHVSHSQFDAEKMVINVANGTLVITRGADGDPISFRDHDPADLITKLSPVEYDPAATCPVFDEFLAFVQPNKEMRRFLLQWLGLSLTGDTSEQRMIFNYGKGKNGKSTLLETAARVAGDYGAALPIESFLDQGKMRNAGQATPDLAMLPGVRFLRTSEPERGAKLAEALIKLATGGDPIQARHLMKEFFSFVPQFKLTMSGNYEPEMSGTDEGIWRRMTLVPWKVTVPKERQDKNLPAKLQRELPGILNRLLDGIRDWLDNGLQLPEEVVAATNEFRNDRDPLGRFLATCTKDGDARVQSSELHQVFVAWAKANGVREWTAQGFGRALRDRGYKTQNSNVNYWLGLELTRKVSDFVDTHGKPIRLDQAGNPVESDASPASHVAPNESNGAKRLEAEFDG